MTGIGLIIVFILAIALMIFCISKLKIHPFLAIMAISLVFGLIARYSAGQHHGRRRQHRQRHCQRHRRRLLGHVLEHRHRDHLRRSGRYAA